MEQHVELWNRCLLKIKDNVGEPMYSTWFAPIVPLSYVNNDFTIQVPSQFFYEYIEEQYAPLLRDVLNFVLGPNAKLLYRIKIDNNENNSNGSITLPPESATKIDNIILFFIKIPLFSYFFTKNIKNMLNFYVKWYIIISLIT